MSWFFYISLLCLTLVFNARTFEARHVPTELPSAVPVGTVSCDACFHNEKDLSRLIPILPGDGNDGGDSDDDDDEPTLPPPVLSNPNIPPPDMNQNRLPPLPPLPLLPRLPPLPHLPPMPLLPPWPPGSH
ncbi:hypothetical protein LINGRAHAP2_LOCUS19082 [Linum grandiflorum]